MEAHLLHTNGLFHYVSFLNKRPVFDKSQPGEAFLSAAWIPTFSIGSKDNFRNMGCGYQLGVFP
jgi:hypothetical protein